MKIDPYPLRWPEAIPRTRNPKQSPFPRPWTFQRATADIQAELRRMKARQIVITSNMPLRIDGQPRASAHPGKDQGIAVYFHRGAAQHVVACDSYTTIGDNAHAIAITLDSLRRIERHGSGQLGAQAFSAFAALPPASGAAPTRHWRDVLGVPDTIDPADQLMLAEAKYRRAVKDSGHATGDDAERMAEINGAIHRAREELR